jgi:hypothetical protein
MAKLSNVTNLVFMRVLLSVGQLATGAWQGSRWLKATPRSMEWRWNDHEIEMTAQVFDCPDDKGKPVFRLSGCAGQFEVVNFLKTKGIHI